MVSEKKSFSSDTDTKIDLGFDSRYRNLVSVAHYMYLNALQVALRDCFCEIYTLILSAIKANKMYINGKHQMGI